MKHFVILGLFCLIKVPFGSATMVEQVSFSDLARASESIVSGQITRSWSEWSPGHHLIWTHYTVEVDAMLKGSPAQFVTISEPGGSVDGLSMPVIGANHYELGEKVVLFLYRTPVGYLRTVGWSQGKWRINADGFLRGGSEGVELVAAQRVTLGAAPRAASAATASSLEGISLAELRRRLAQVDRRSK